MNPLTRLRTYALTLLALLIPNPPRLRLPEVVPSYSEQLSLSFYVMRLAWDQTDIDLRWRVPGGPWRPEPSIHYPPGPGLAPGIQCWINNLAPGTRFEIDARTRNSINGGTSEWTGISMWTLP